MRVPIRWLNVNDPSLKGRAITISSGDSENRIPIPDGEILCDHCNDQITQSPFCVIEHEAICKKCQAGMNIKDGDLVYDEKARRGEAVPTSHRVRVKIMGRTYSNDYCCLECGQVKTGREGLVISLLPCDNNMLTEVFICGGCAGKDICREQTFDLGRYNKAAHGWPYA